jgi:hypothetical protein
MGLAKARRVAAGADMFSPEHYMSIYTAVTRMATQKPPHDFASELYALFKEEHVSYLTELCLANEWSGAHTGRELVLKLIAVWTRFSQFAHWSVRFFSYLDRYSVSRLRLPALEEVVDSIFYTTVLSQLNAAQLDTVFTVPDGSGPRLRARLGTGMASFRVAIKALGQAHTYMTLVLSLCHSQPGRPGLPRLVARQIASRLTGVPWQVAPPAGPSGAPPPPMFDEAD